MNVALPDKGKIVSISIAHLFNDWYMNTVQTLLPFMVAAGLGVARGAFLVSAFTVTSSLLQPVFGYFVDQKNQRWLVYAGTLWMAVLLSLVGVLENYLLLFVVVTLAGLGTAAFHPQASALVSASSGRRKGFMQACFVAAGNVGWALPPLLVVPFVQAYGLRSTPWLVVPGVLVAILLYVSAPDGTARVKASPSPFLPVLRSSWRELGTIVLVVTCRSLAYFGLIAFLPLYLQQEGVPLVVGGRLVFLMLFTGAVGGLVGGYVSDALGRKGVIVVSLAAASPLFWLFLQSSGFQAAILLALAGGCLLASFSVTIVATQEIISGNAAMAAGLMLGFGIGMGGLGVGLVGLLSERLGIGFAVRLLIWLPLLAGVFALRIKTPAKRSTEPACTIR